MTTTIYESDKNYWHKYLTFYESEFAGLTFESILEFGIWRGASIRWLLDRYPSANIYGADILAVQEDWPQSEKIQYFQMNQADVAQIKTIFNEIGCQLDLIIEDGSHIPEHQRNCLVESVQHIKSGGLYILEDIHTSHPNHPYYKKSKKIFKPLVGPLHLLLAIEHLKLFNIDVNYNWINNLSINSLFNRDQIELLFEKISTVKIYKRTTLPHRCFDCGGVDFDYAKLQCRCGVQLYSETDSMSALIRIK